VSRPDVNDSRGAALGDVDGDGNVDAVFANFNQPLSVTGQVRSSVVM
jgi:hypothetical protein